MAISSALGTGSLTPGVCTSSTRPTAPFEGQLVYETDTDRVLIWNNSAWVMPNSIGTVPNFLVYMSGANGSATNGATIGYNTELYDDTNNVVSGVFTVPAGQTGVYSFTVGCNIYNIGTSGYARVDIVTSGSSGAYSRGSQTPAQGSTDVFSTASLVVKLAEADTVLCRFIVPATGSYSAGITYNWFSGVRVR